MTLKEAAELALQAIDEGWLFERIDNEVAPALRQAIKQSPMTDAQINDLVYTVSVEGSYCENLVRAVEIYHGVR